MGLHAFFFCMSVLLIVILTFMKKITFEVCMGISSKDAMAL